MEWKEKKIIIKRNGKLAGNPRMSAFRREMRIISLIKSCKHKPLLLQIHSHLLHSSHFYDPTVFLAFLSRLALPPIRDLSYSGSLFSAFPAPNVSLYNTIIHAHSLSRDSAHRGFQYYQELVSSGISSDALSATAAVKCCTKIRWLRGGEQVHARVWRGGCCSDNLLMTTLMDFYAGLEKGSEVHKVFDEMPVKDVVAWNVLISSYTRNKRSRDALLLFDAMIASSNECKPDAVTCLHALKACGNLNSLEWGEKVHGYVREEGLINEKNVCNSLVKMYSHCGSIEKAYRVFQQLKDRDVVSWSAMISGLASDGNGRDAIEAFKQMQMEGIRPSDHTFTGLLSACSRSRLVDEGRMIFQAMSRDFGVKPNLHHHGCMVDLLGRAGFLQEAYELILSMRMKPDAAMWRTLLGACRIHGNFVLGEKLLDHLTEAKAQEAGDYVLLSNIYSSCGNSEKVMEVRKLMKDKGIHTTPASSTIELKRKVHEFLADDVSHPRTKEIYETLAEINQQLRIGGYVAEITSETKPRKECHTLSYHSEKLAIAFGILSTLPGTTIRVAKDLRICVDCHNFCKALSAVYNRKVVIRDRNRFHHFREGRCSCNDYW